MKRGLDFPLARPTWPANVERPAPKRRVGLAFDHGWSRRYPARLARALLLDNVTRPAIRLVTATTTRGVEYLEHLEAPVIFAANHASHLDTPLLLHALPARFRHKSVVGAASDYFFDRTWKALWWSLTLAAIPIDRNRVNRRSGDDAARIIEEGWNLIIFPEGGRTADGWAQPFRGGAAYLAHRTKRPVVPVYIHGMFRVLPKSLRDDRPAGGSGSEMRHRGLRRSPTSVLFGPPLRLEEGEDARHFAARIERAVAQLAEEVRSDWWGARRAGADAAMTALRGPDVSPWRRAWARDATPRRSPSRGGNWPVS